MDLITPEFGLVFWTVNHVSNFTFYLKKICLETYS